MDGSKANRGKPVSVRLLAAETEALRDMAKAMNVSLSEAARRAILAYTGRKVRTVDRKMDGHALQKLGALRHDLQRVGNLYKLAISQGVGPAASAEGEVTQAVAEIRTLARAMVERYTHEQFE